jgi:hypothetical protein
MFKATIEAHNLKAIETDPEKIRTLEAETLSKLAEEAAVAICGQSPLISNGYAITVTYTRAVTDPGINHKGQRCPVRRGLLCQEGFCEECAIYNLQ